MLSTVLPLNNSPHNHLKSVESSANRIKWKIGYRNVITSKCGNYNIQPLYFNSNTAHPYEVSDNTGRHQSCIRRSQRDCKRIAERWTSELAARESFMT